MGRGEYHFVFCAWAWSHTASSCEKSTFPEVQRKKKNAVNRDSKGKMIQEEWKDLKGKILTIHE